MTTAKLQERASNERVLEIILKHYLLDTVRSIS